MDMRGRRAENRRPCYQRAGISPSNALVTMRSQTVLTARNLIRLRRRLTSTLFGLFPGATRTCMATEKRAAVAWTKPPRRSASERPHWVLDDAVYSISALLLSVIIIHSIWTLIIRPRAEAVLSQRVTVTNSQQRQGSRCSSCARCTSSSRTTSRSCASSCACGRCCCSAARRMTRA